MSAKKGGGKRLGQVRLVNKKDQLTLNMPMSRDKNVISHLATRRCTFSGVIKRSTETV